MPSGPNIELPKLTRLVFNGGAETTIPLSPAEFRNLLKQAGAQGALFITVPKISGTLDLNLQNLAFFEQGIANAT